MEKLKTGNIKIQENKLINIKIVYQKKILFPRVLVSKTIYASFVFLCFLIPEPSDQHTLVH